MKYLNIKKALTAWQELQPLSEKDKDRLSRRFTVDFNYNSNHIEEYADLWPNGNLVVIRQGDWRGKRARCARNDSKQCGVANDDRRG